MYIEKKTIDNPFYKFMNGTIQGIISGNESKFLPRISWTRISGSS